MPEGIFLISWSNILGSYIDAKYPDNSTINEEEIIKYLATIQVLSTSNSFQINDGNRIALFSGIPPKKSTNSQDVNYDFIVLILKQEETIDIDKFQLMLRKFATDIITTNKLERKNLFLNFARKFFTTSAKKIVFLGLPESGKTTTKMFLFDKIKEDQLLTTSITPTQGIEISHHRFIDVNISLFDTSGQELGRWLDENENTFVSSELVVFFFSVINWKTNKEQVVNNLEKLCDTIKKIGDNSIQLIIFCHKADLLTENADIFRNEVITYTKSLNLITFFTSILDGGNQDLILGTQLILQKFSTVTNILQELINPIMKDLNIQLLFLIDSNFRVLINYDSDKFHEQDQESFRRLLPMFILNYDRVYGRNPNFFIIESRTTHKFILTLNLRYFSKDFAYIVMIINNLESVSEIYNRFLDILESMK